MSKSVKGDTAATVNAANSVDAMFEGGEALAIGFPPYYSPETGDVLIFEPLFKDARDPEFVRYVCKALVPVNCETGSRVQGKNEAVRVMPGERFCISDYISLPLAMLLGEPAIPVKVVVGDNVPVPGTAKTRWEFKLIVPPKMLAAAKQRIAAYIPENVGPKRVKPKAGLNGGPREQMPVVDSDDVADAL